MKKLTILVLGLIMFSITTFLLFALPLTIKEPFDTNMRVCYTVMMFLGYTVSYLYFLIYNDLLKSKIK